MGLGAESCLRLFKAVTLPHTPALTLPTLRDAAGSSHTPTVGPSTESIEGSWVLGARDTKQAGT